MYLGWYRVVRLTVVVVWSLDILNESVSVDGDVVSILLEVELDHRALMEVVLQCVALHTMSCHN